jgi:hypothetical protein
MFNLDVVIKKYISWLCFLITLIAIRIIYCSLFKQLNGNFIPYMISMGFPLLFNIKKRMYRNITLILGGVATLITQQWIALFCICLSFLIVLWIKQKLLVILLLIGIISFSVSAIKIYPQQREWGWSLDSLQNRLVFYSTAMRNWNHLWFGQGYDSFKTLPENQPNNNPYGDKWIHNAHSDLLQGFYEFGIVGMIPILFLVLLPICFIELNTLLNLTIFSSYLCVLFQALIDFPFHRWSTGLLGLMIICLMYYISYDRICQKL